MEFDRESYVRDNSGLSCAAIFIMGPAEIITWRNYRFHLKAMKAEDDTCTPFSFNDINMT
jgi:hypothetical protein